MKADLYEMIRMNIYFSMYHPRPHNILRLPTSAEVLAESIAIVEDVCGPMEAIELLEECGL